MRGIHILCWIFLANAAAAQEKFYVCGFVNDIATLQPLSHVNIYSATSVIGVTDRNGSFCLTITRQDSLAFTRIGYEPHVTLANKTDWDVRIFLTQLNKPLSDASNHHYKIHGADEIERTLKDPKIQLENFTNDPRRQADMVQTFGPGFSSTRVTKDARERKRLESVAQEKARTTVFSEFITSPILEEYFMESFRLDRETLMKYKEGFIVANPNARYLTTRQDIIDLMAAYFAMKK